jgi:hypothetical protein
MRIREKYKVEEKCVLKSSSVTSPDIITVQETKKNGKIGPCGSHTELCSET